ncbi:hypothetical protein HYDPIDRAFT_29284 [Hydnomerulius pinastri MD-312]|uniref:Glutathione transferase n=1 Tax=Hydnomerulius pinastri MD-312 TaxID=994086 RepID=A0A0C9WDZ3_9AGAM|nr:hypothetical protein HYDPIDRAFT_29284 [Hydnomerulius pinastri MD-312]
MSHPQQITLYTAKASPFAHRVSMALEEAKADAKPEWFAAQVNPADKVPAITYGGPDVPPSSPSSESTKLAESLVIVEFIADLYPDSNLLPKDPVLRAKARFFIETFTAKFSPRSFILRNEPYQPILDAIAAIQDLLPESGMWAVGDAFSIADLNFAPLYARFKLTIDSGLGMYEPGKDRELLNAMADPKYAKFNAYVAHLLERPSFKATWDEAYVKAFMQVRLARPS